MPSNSTFKVLIVGGGPAGLTAAHALHHAGIDFVVLERRDTVVLDQGASLVVTPQSLRVMQQFGVLDELREMGGELRRSTALTREGREFRDSTMFCDILRENHGSAPVAFHRADLVRVLYNALPGPAKDRYLLSKKVVDITTHDSGVTVTCADGSVFSGDMVLGADGVHSRTRSFMRSLALAADPARLKDWDEQVPFPAEYRCMWCSFPRPEKTSAPGDTFETQHKDQSVMYLAGRERSWIFLYEKLERPTKERVNYTAEDVEAFADRFADFPVTHELNVRDVYERRLTAGMSNLEEGVLKHWSWERIVLVGDACHKMTPNAGRGFNSGVQDVVALCNELRRVVHSDTVPGPEKQKQALSTAELQGVFQRYQDMRLKALQADYRLSVKVTRMHAWADSLSYFMARYVMSWDFVVYVLIDWLEAREFRKGLVLDYVAAKEPFHGRVSWAYPMKGVSS